MLILHDFYIEPLFIYFFYSMVLSYGVFGDSYFVVLLRKKVVGGDDLNSCEKCLFSF